MADRKVLIIYYSCSGQTRKLVNAFAAGLEECGVEVGWQPLRPIPKIPFPAGSMGAALLMMVHTFCRRRNPIGRLDGKTGEQWQAIVLAGPTWSYNPSGPVLSLLDDHGEIFLHRPVLPLISCRSYWRLHYWQLRALLRARGARVLSPLVFKHPGKEPWRTIGVFLKMAGRNPENDGSWIGKFYKGYGHSGEQVDCARNKGRSLAAELLEYELV
ncbi:MAG TPA: hypothetical protein VJ969_05865 [Desulfopila sp.]|nr:hypothetical protein [Desulfopila sp.]